MIFTKNVISTGINQIWRLISGPITLLIIPYFLKPIEQGYWYTYLSLAALAMFADLGFSNIILQFSAHEFAFLTFDCKGNIVGDNFHIKRLASFFRFSIKWLIIITAIGFPIIMLYGIYFLNLRSDSNSAVWFLPWILYVFGTALYFFISTLLLFFEGCNSVAISQTINLIVSITRCIVIWICLASEMGLLALGISIFICTISEIVLFLYKFGKASFFLWEFSKNAKYSWLKEFTNLLWRYAISWISGYFLFQMFVPVAFNYFGPVEAGKIGLSISLWSALASVSDAWLIAITPQINILVEKKVWEELDKLFTQYMKYAVYTYVLGSISFFIVYIMFCDKFWIFNRIGNLSILLTLCLSWFCLVIINAIAVYLRAYKKEPMMRISIFNGIFVSITTILCAKYLSISHLFIGFLISNVIILPFVFYLLKFEFKQHAN